MSARAPRALTDARAATVTFVLALLGFPAMVLVTDLGFLLGATATLVGWQLLRRGRVKRQWRRMTIASCAIGSFVVLIYLMDTALVAGFRG
jgi:uncharacterized membrane protein YozB (DUF420 family)